MGEKTGGKYHISDEGKVFRVNDDGSFTEVGNVKDLSNPAENKQTTVPPPLTVTNDKPGSFKKFVIALLIVVGIMFTIGMIQILRVVFYGGPAYDGVDYGDSITEDSAVIEEEVIDSADVKSPSYSRDYNYYESASADSAVYVAPDNYYEDTTTYNDSAYY